MKKNKETISFKDKLLKLRTDRDLSRKQLAEMCGISDRTIQSYELGNREPNLETVKKLSKALNVNPDELTMCLSQYKSFKNLNTIESVYDLFDNDAVFYSLVQGLTKMALYLKQKYDSTSGEEREKVISRVNRLSFLLDTINEYMKFPNDEDAKIVLNALNEFFAIDGIKTNRDDNE